MNYRDQIMEMISHEESILFHAYVPLERHLSKKNSRTIGRIGKRLIPTKSYDLVKAEKLLIRSFLEQRTEGSDTINEPIWAIFIFYFERSQFFTKKNQISKVTPDLSNLYELPQDCLQEAGVIANDNLIWSHDLSRKIPADHTGLEVILLAQDQDFVEFIQSKRLKDADD